MKSADVCAFGPVISLCPLKSGTISIGKASTNPTGPLPRVRGGVGVTVTKECALQGSVWKAGYAGVTVTKRGD